VRLLLINPGAAREGNHHEDFEEESFGCGDVDKGFCRPGLALLPLGNSNGVARPVWIGDAG
jgi:hypothetical protein